MTVVIGALFGLAAGLGVVVAALAATGMLPAPSAASADRRRRSSDAIGLRVTVGLAGAVLAAVVTGWPVAIVLTGAAFAAAPSLLGAKRRRDQVIARTEAIASWAEMLRDTMAAAAGLEEAIVTTARVAPPPIRAEVQRLAARIERDGLDEALARFADPIGDMVAASILLTARRQARHVGDLLGAVASSARANASMRMKIEATRARTYTSVRMVVLITLGFSAGLVVFSRDYLAPFDDALGQLVLLAIGAIFGVAYASMVKMAEVGGPARLLSRLRDDT